MAVASPLTAVRTFAQQQTRASLLELQRLRGALLQPLHAAPCSAEERQRVQSRAADVPSLDQLTAGEVQLSLKLSDELAINEAAAVCFVARAKALQPQAPEAERLQLAAGLYFEERVCSFTALHELLEATASGLISAPGVAVEADAFVQELLTARVGADTLLHSLAVLVQQSVARLRLQLSSITSLSAASPLHEVLLGAVREKRETLERNDLLLLAESLFFTTALRRSVSLEEGRAVLTVLGSMASCLAPHTGLSQADLLPAHAVFFSALAALKPEKLDDASALTLLTDCGQISYEPLRATVRLGLALASQSGSEEPFRAVGTAGVFPFLLSVMRHQLRLRDLYIDTAHSLLTSFLDDGRGRNQVKVLFDTNQAAFGQLLLFMSVLYREGLEDLPGQCEPLWDFIDFVTEEIQKATEKSAGLLIGMLELLGSLTPAHADDVWTRLHSRSSSLIGDMVAAAMIQYGNLFAAEAAQAFQGRSVYDDATGQQRVHMPPEDVDALVSYLGTIRRFADQGELTRQRVQQLEGKLNQPLLFFVFTLLDFPVPPRLKAALFDLLRSFAAEPLGAATIWSHLEAVAVIHKPQTDSDGFVVDLSAASKMDITFQLNEVESREETYPETLAYILLINRLLELSKTSGTGPAKDAGAAAAHVFAFVRDSVFLSLDRRTYCDVAERWRLAAACQAHFRILAEIAQAGFQMGALPAHTPGGELLVDFDNERPVIRRVFSALSGGAERLEQEAFSQLGVEQERCVCEALELLLAALGLDRLASVLSNAQSVALQPLDVLLMRDRRRVADLFSFVRFSRSTPLQTAAVQIIHAVAQRNERLAVSVDAETLQALKYDIALALQSGLGDALSPQDEVPASATTANAIQLLLLDSLRQSSASPRLAHLLLGFEPTTEGGVLQMPPDSFSSLSVLLDFAAILPEEAVGWSSAYVSVLERAFEILSVLAADRRSSGATVARIRSSLPLPSILAAAASRPLADSPFEQALTMHSNAWLLSLTAAMLHDTPGAVQILLDGDGVILRTLLSRGETAGGMRTILKFLQASAAGGVAPTLSLALSQRLMDLGLDFLLAPDSSTQLSTILRVEKGASLYDVAGVDALLRSRTAQLGLPLDAALVQAVLQHFVQCNDWRRVEAAASHLLTSWCELLGVLLGKRFPAVRVLLDGEEAGVSSALADILFSVLELVPTAGDARCALLLQSSHLLLVKLSGPEATPASSLPPSSCHTVFRLLLSVLLRSDRSDSTRHFACASLLAYLRLCSPPLWVNDSSPDAPHLAMQQELDAGNLAELRRMGGLLPVLARDSLCGSEDGRTQSLAVLEACLGLVEGAGAVLESGIFMSGLPAAVASAVERTPRSALQLPPPACRRTLEALNAQLCFLIALARYTPCGPSQLIACGAVSSLAGCAMLDAHPEECSEPTQSLRRTVLLPSLQLVTMLVELAPDSAELNAQALAFAGAHSTALLRLLEQDQAHLPSTRAAMLLVSRLVTREWGRSSPALSRFREALERACWQYFELEPNALADGASSTHLLGIQSLLAAHIRRLVVAKRVSLPAGSRETAGLRVGTPSLLLLSRLIARLTNSLFDQLRMRHQLTTGLELGSAAMQALSRVHMNVRLLLLALENALESVHSTLSCAPSASSREKLSYDLVPVLDDLGRVPEDMWLGGRDGGFLRLLSRRLRVLLELGPPEVGV